MLHISLFYHSALHNLLTHSIINDTTHYIISNFLPIIFYYYPFTSSNKTRTYQLSLPKQSQPSPWFTATIQHSLSAKQIINLQWPEFNYLFEFVLFDVNSHQCTKIYILVGGGKCGGEYWSLEIWLSRPWIDLSVVCSQKL